jgi:hypothetical protein
MILQWSSEWGAVHLARPLRLLHHKLEDNPSLVAMTTGRGVQRVQCNRLSVLTCLKHQMYQRILSCLSHHRFQHLRIARLICHKPQIIHCPPSVFSHLYHQSQLMRRVVYQAMDQVQGTLRRRMLPMPAQLTRNTLSTEDRTALRGPDGKCGNIDQKARVIRAVWQLIY